MAKVIVSKCLEYKEDEIYKIIEDSIDKLGGLKKYIKSGETVLLKANLLMKKRPEEATTTHPVFVKALSKYLLDNGVKVVIGDSPGGPFLENRLKTIYKACGYEEISEVLDVELNYNTNSVISKCSDAKLLKRQEVIEVLTMVDKVISVSKLKTHGMMTFTGAVKNMFGVIPGVLKAEYHFKMPKVDDFADALVDICLNAKPILSFMDGIVAMEGQGPSAGNPRSVGAVLISDSPYHLDDVAVRIIGLDPERVPTISASYNRGLLNKNLEDTDIIGIEPKDFNIHDFIIPNNRGIEFFEKSPTIIKNTFDILFKPRPIFDHGICIGCGDCARSCPSKVIDMIDKKPYVNLEGCIRCYCCHELCPVKAVHIHRSLLLKLFVKDK